MQLKLISHMIFMKSMGLIDEIKGVEEIINETISQFNEVCKKMGNHNFTN